MDTIFLIFSGLDYEGSHLQGARLDRHEAIEAAQRLARSTLHAGRYWDHIRVMEVPAGNWGADLMETDYPGKTIWSWYRPFMGFVRSSKPMMSVDLYPGSQSSHRASRHVRTRGPMGLIQTETGADPETHLSDELWQGQTH